MQIKMKILKEDRKGRPTAFTVFLFYFLRKTPIFLMEASEKDCVFVRKRII